MKKALILILVCIILTSTSCSKGAFKVKIDRKPMPGLVSATQMFSLPKYNPEGENPFIDLRGRDLSGLELWDREEDLMHCTFDSTTVWPQTSVPEGYNYAKILEDGKNPGLKIRELHKNRITGKGIGIAMIDFVLLTNHVEYKNNLRLYEEIGYYVEVAQMPGPEVASIAAGKNVGVAPDADLYYIAANINDPNTRERNLTNQAKAITRILEINKTLAEDRKIRVISILWNWQPGMKGYQDVIDAVERAKREGIFVISPSLLETYGFKFTGVDRNPNADPDKTDSYEISPKDKAGFKEFIDNSGPMLQNKETMDKYNKMMEKHLLIPTSSRTYASETGENNYLYWRIGGNNWAIPYLAGLYALSCQVKPDITAEVFWDKMLETGDTFQVEVDGQKYNYGKLISPVKLIEELQKK